MISSLTRLNPFFMFLYTISFGLLFLYIAQKKVDKKILALLFFSFIGLIGLTLSPDFLTFFIFWDLILISSYPLLKYKNEEGADPGLTFLFLSGAGVVLLFASLSFFFSFRGNLAFKSLAALSGSKAILVFSLMVVSFLVEAVIVPFHFWAPKAYETSRLFIVAFFASLLSKAGIFGLMIVLNFSAGLLRSTMMVLALLSMTFANYLALTQENIKRVFAFGSIAHLSFIVYAFSLGTRFGLKSGLFHTFNHAIVTLGLFLSLDSLSLDTFKLKKLKGGSIKATASNICFLISNLAAGGMPPFSLFFSELMIVMSSLRAGYTPTVILIFNMLLALIVFLRVVHNSFKKQADTISQTKVTQKVVLVLLILLIIGVGVYPPLLFNFLP